jgi:hypothetical protein
MAARRIVDHTRAWLAELNTATANPGRGEPQEGEKTGL